MESERTAAGKLTDTGCDATLRMLLAGEDDHERRYILSGGLVGGGKGGKSTVSEV